ncbi:uncharacterized protein LOC114313203 [Camellia sinensis]|uniref:uncharacterized protein LOC114313203 n=1 Tax=Camellia sinensis TaxID=4442 RepID=UPI001036A153|nr:uncharacterized protein LOC114313203 [Camellia sinensis]
MEARATVQMRKSLGINFEGKEDEAIEKTLQMEMKDLERIKGSGRAFKVEVKKSWDGVVEQRWASIGLKRKLANLWANLRRWKSEVFGSVDIQLKEADEEQHELDLVAGTRNLSEAELTKKKEVRSQVWNFSKRKESLWHKKSRMVWVKCGDKNTSFFHLMASSRQRKNMLDSVMKEVERLVDPNRVKQSVCNHFERVFIEQWCSRPKLSSPFLSITFVQKESLEATFTEQEVWTTIQDCDGNKTPRPDGFNMACIQKCWKIMKNEFLQFMNEFHENEKWSQA